MTCPSTDGNRNLLLALHFGEGDPRTAAATRAHVEGCAACGRYLAELEDLGRVLRAWPDAAPPPGMGPRIVAQAALVAQAAPARRAPAARPPRARADALPLLALVPLMGALVELGRRIAGWLPDLAFWPRIEEWPSLAPVLPVLPVVAATLVLLAIGGLATLAAAPALMLESRRQET
jgi:hypothetical protein